MMTPANVTTYGGIGGPAGTAEVTLTSFDMFGTPDQWGTPDVVIQDDVTAAPRPQSFCSGAAIPGVSNCLLLGAAGVLFLMMVMKRR
jgi:hypothetical protein